VAAALWIAVLAPILAFWIAVVIAALWLRFRMPILGPAEPTDVLPPLAVVVPSRNEAAGVEAATRSLLSQRYPGLQVIAVDDRSDDGTGEILDRLARADPRLHVIHVVEVPDDWLGKNHACHAGSRETTATWILFTDGDVVFDDDALARAVGLAERHRLDHLVVLPRLVAPGFFERAFVASFGIFMSLKFRPWGLRRAGSKSFVGVGAFNLVRREAYERVGGHARLRFEVVDDAKLGLVLRRSGCRQGVAESGGAVRVRWNLGFRQTLRGLMKNSFAAVEWKLAEAIGVAIFLAALIVIPWLGLWLAPELVARWLAAGSLAIPAVLVGGSARYSCDGLGVEGLVWPVTFLALAGVAVMGPLTATLRGGIDWRGRFYPLDALRRACVRERDWPKSGAVGW
jgi:cellulose synthase/poly-beta-1,6-N-acetylglucosamine synthase-like glycosyltransferase